MKIVILMLILFGWGFFLGYEAHTEPVMQTSDGVTVIYRYPTTPPYEAFDEPIDFDQALILLQGMRASHVQALNWTFETSPGFGIDDIEFQKQCIEWYDQLIDYIYRNE